MGLFDVARASFRPGYVVRACVRRWYVILPLLLVMAVYGHHHYHKVAPVYYANSVIGLAPPSFRTGQTAPGAPVPRNGLMDIGGAPLIANMTAIGLREPSVIDKVVAGGGAHWYVSRVFPSPSTFLPQMPLIMVEVTTDSPALTTKTLELVAAQSQEILRTLQQQARVPEDQMVTAFVVSPPSAPTAAKPINLDSAIAKFAAGAALSILLTVLLDVLLTRRRSRAQHRREPSVEASTGSNPGRTPNEGSRGEGAAPVAEDAVDAR
jgi:hypothetical protein